jgi:hypothetical protein
MVYIDFKTMVTRLFIQVIGRSSGPQFFFDLNHWKIIDIKVVFIKFVHYIYDLTYLCSYYRSCKILSYTCSLMKVDAQNGFISRFYFIKHLIIIVFHIDIY